MFQRHIAMTKRKNSAPFAAPPPARRRSRRLQKKLRIGAFQEFGFAVALRLSDALTPQQQDDAWSAFITELIEARGLAFGGGASGYVTRVGRGSATQADREAVASWWTGRFGVERIVVGPLDDAWYGPAVRAP